MRCRVFVSLRWGLLFVFTACLQAAEPDVQLALAPISVRAATLRVGPGQQFVRPSQAIAAAKDGDVIEIDAKGDYRGDHAKITKNKLTLRGVGQGRAKLPCKGNDIGDKGIWNITGSDAVVENIEFSGARVRDRNGAGIRPEGQNLTVRNCRFYDCENGILTGRGELLVEYCEFEHCGPVGQPATHSLYIAESCTKLTFQYNYSTDVIQGHLLKSRAKENYILYNRLTDGAVGGSAVMDFPNGGYVVVVGNSLQKSRNAQNDRVIAWGMENVTHSRNALYVVNNTMVYEHRHTNNVWFVRADHTPADFTAVIRNNLCIGAIPLTNVANAEKSGNLLLNSVADAGLVEAAQFDYRIKTGSPAIGKGIPPGMAGTFDLTPKFEYVHPCSMKKRPNSGTLDAGAFQHGAANR